MTKAVARFGWVVLASGVLFGTAAYADPATLHIGPGAGTTCATGGCPIFIGGALNNEVNNFDATGLDIYQNSNGAKALVDPVLLILAIPNNTVSLTAGAITSASLYAPYPGSATPVSFGFGTTSFGINAASGFAGLMTSGDVYSFLGLTGMNNSNSFTNWSAAELRMAGTKITDFGIYVYSIDTSHFAGNDLLDIGLSGIPEGTFAVAYGEDASGKAYGTPFTEAGLQDVPVEPIPEPSTLVLFASVLLGLLGLQARRRA